MKHSKRSRRSAITRDWGALVRLIELGGALVVEFSRLDVGFQAVRDQMILH
jgi:hypothetical protein